MHKLLLISYLFPPAGGPHAPASIRLGKFAQYLPDFGWEPIVVTAGYKSFYMCDETLTPDIHILIERVNDIVPLFRGRDRISSWLPTPGLMLPWAVRAAKKGAIMAKMYNCNLILASSPPPASLIAGYIIHKATGLPLVLDYRDQWTLSPYRIGLSIYRSWDKRLEKRILRNTSLVIVSNEARKSEHTYYWKGNTPKTITISNGYDLKDFYSLSPDRSTTNKIRRGLVVRHIGAIYGARALSTISLLKVLNKYLLTTPNAPIVKLQFFGKLNKKSVILKGRASPKLMVEIFPNVKHREALRLELGADVLLLIIGKHTQAQAEVTSKIFEYIVSGRPILICGESPLLREMMKEFDNIFWLGMNPTKEKIENFFCWLDDHLIGLSFEDIYKKLKKSFFWYDRCDQTKKLAMALNESVKKT